MIKITQTFTLVLFASLCGLARGQDIPAVTSSGASPYRGFSLPDTAGAFTFGVTGSESTRRGFYSASGSEVYLTNISGSVGYLSNSARYPFKLTYSGGYSYTSLTQRSSPFQSLAVNQTLGFRNWTFDITDAIRFLPESATGGLSGIPGQGDVGTPSPTPGGQEILSNYGQRVSNSTTGNVERKLTGSTSLTGGGALSLQRFVGSGTGGFDYNQFSGQGGLNHRIDALSQLGVEYSYNRFSYLNQPFSFTSQGVNVNYTKQWSRRLNTAWTVGPEWHATSDPSISSRSVDLSANISISYLYERSTVSAGYDRGVHSGSGIVQGTVADIVHADFHRSLGEHGSVNVSASYGNHRQIFAVTNAVTYSTVVGEIEASRQFGTNISGYISYAALEQSSQNALATTNAFNGLSQTVAVGLRYSPKPKHLGH